MTMMVAELEQVEPEQTVVTPTVGRFFRRARFWIVAALFVAVVVAGYTWLSPPSLTDQRLGPTGTGMTGSRALLQVLSRHGVSVTATTSLAATRSAIASRTDTTVLVYDPSDFLDAEQLASIPTLASHVVVVSPGSSQLRALDPDITLVGASAASPTAQCDLLAARRASRIGDGGRAYRVDSNSSSYTTCFPSGDNDFSLVQRTMKSSTFSVVGTTKAFTNRYIGDRGNAALAINLVGSSRNLVWYLPSLEDVGASGRTESLAQAAPAWFTSFSVLVLLVILAAAIWRGRRFGPLVVERMPVTVRASETMEGRARLYQASSARVRALDSLRIGTITRVGRMCGLPRAADVDQVAAAAAATTGRPLADVRATLLDAIPHNDAELVRLSDGLRRLESAVADATGVSGVSERDSRRRE